MKIRYLGTGAAEGVPAAFCNCPVCQRAKKMGGREVHTRSQVLIGDNFGIEFPPDAYYHSFRFGVDLSAIKNLIVTHSHMDHFYAHDFILRGYKYAKDLTSPTLSIFGNEEVLKVFEECTRRELRDEVKGTIFCTPLYAFEERKIGEFLVTPLPAQHSKKESAFVYLVENGDKGYLHLTDTGRLPWEVYDYLKAKKKKISLVCFDCTFLRYTCGEVGRHMGIEDNMFVKKKLEEAGVVNESTRYLITHYSHNNNPTSENLLSLEREYGVKALFDGDEVEW